MGIALWALDGSTKEDGVGRYLSGSDLVATFREWFVVNKKSASSVVSKVKREMFKADFIMIAGGSDHIHLTEKGTAAARGMIERVSAVVRRSVSVLQPEERGLLLEFANRMLSASRKKSAGTASL